MRTGSSAKSTFSSIFHGCADVSLLQNEKSMGIKCHRLRAKMSDFHQDRNLRLHGASRGATSGSLLSAVFTHFKPVLSISAPLFALHNIKNDSDDFQGLRRANLRHSAFTWRHFRFFVIERESASALNSFEVTMLQLIPRRDSAEPRIREKC